MGAGGVAVNVSVLGNMVTNNVRATIEESDVTAAGDIVVSAQDLAPSVIPAWIVPDQYQEDLDACLNDSPIDLDANILSATVNVAGGGVAVNVALVGNLIVNTTAAKIDNSTVTSNSGKVELGSDSESGIISLNVGVAGGGVAVGVVGYGNEITNIVESTVEGGSVVHAGGLVDISAENMSTIRAIGIGVAAGPVAVGVMAAGNLIVSTVDARVDASEVTSGTTLDITAISDSNIMALTGGVAAGGVGVNVAFSGNMITGFTTAEVVSGSELDAGGAMTIHAENSSTIDALSFGVAAGGVGVGVALSANVIVNWTEALISGSTVTNAASLDVLSESSSIIRALAIGVAGGGVAVNVNVLGNLITNETTATVLNSTVTADGDVTVSAEELSPSIIPDWVFPLAGDLDLQQTLDDNLADSPLSLDSNIVSANITLSGGAGVAVGVNLTGNLITNITDAAIVNSVVRAGTLVDGTVTNSAADISVSAHSTSGITSLSAGLAAAAGVGVSATGFGNIITNTIQATVEGNATARAGGSVDISASDDSMIRSIGLSAAGAGGVAAGVIAGVNVITNNIESLISGSTVSSGSTLSVSAQSQSDIFGFVGGVAAAGAASGLLSMAGNVITNTIRAEIENEGATRSDVDAGGTISILAKDASIIDSIAVGLAAGIGGAAGAATSLNLIENTVKSAINTSDADSLGDISLTSESVAIIRSLAAGVAAAVGLSGQASVTLNEVSNETCATIDDSTVSAAGDVLVSANDKAPSVDDFLLNGLLPDDVVDSLSESLADADIDLAVNILAFAGSIGGGGLAAGSAAVSDNKIKNKILASIIDSDVSSSTAGIAIDADSDAEIASLALGVGVAAGAALNASVSNNTIASDITAKISGDSLLSAATNIDVDAADSGTIESFALSLSGALGAALGGVIVNNDLANDTRAYIEGTSDTGSVRIAQANQVSVTAQSTKTIKGWSLGVTAGIVSAGASLVDATVEGSTRAYVGDYVEIGQSDGLTVNSLAVEASSTTDVVVDVYAVSAGVGAGSYNQAKAVVNPTIEAYIDGAEVDVQSQIDVKAEKDVTISAKTTGVNVGLLALGASLAEAESSGQNLAYVGGNIEHCGGLLISANTEEDISARTVSGAGGIVAGSGSIPEARAATETSASTSSQSQITSTGDIVIEAADTPHVEAEAEGINGGALSVGVSIATAAVDSTVTAQVGANSTLNAANLEVSGSQSTPDGKQSAYAHASGSSGGLVGVVATEATVVNNSDVTAVVKENSTLTITGTTIIDAQLDSSQSSLADGYAGGLVAAGGNSATTTTNTSVSAELEDGVSLIGNTLNMTAGGGDNNMAAAVSGSGGFVSVSASEASTFSNNLTEVAIGAGSSSVSIDVAHIDLSAEHLAEFNSSADSSSGGVVDAPGADIYNQVDTTVNTVIGADAVINAETLSASASNEVLKDWLSDDAYNLISASGGIGSFPAGSSTTKISNRAGVYVEDRAQITADSDADDSGTAGFTAYTDVVARDKAKIDTGGAVATAKTESYIYNDTNVAEVQIGAAQLVTSGDLSMASWSEVDIEARSSAKTYGLAGYAQGLSEATVNLDNTILIGEGAMIEAGGDINLIAGGDNSGNSNNISATAQTDLWNKSVLPISSDPMANAEIDHSSLITVETDAYLGSRADINLTAKGGSHGASGSWSYQDLYQGLAEDIANGISSLFGGGTVSLKETGGAFTDDLAAGVQIDGIAEAGLGNQQFLIVDETITVERDAVVSGDPTLTFSSVSGEDSISRSSGSWLDEGFEVGQYITMSGSGDNDGAYKIVAVDALTLTLDVQTALDETASVVTGVTVQSGILQGNPTLDFSAENDTISRSEGSWIEDGFVVVNADRSVDSQTLYVSGAGANDGFYTIVGISADGKTVYLSEDIELDATAVAGVSVRAAEDTTTELGDPSLTFSGSTIVRSDGRWADDGFASGQVIEVTGTDDNDGYYTIGSVSGDTLTLVESLANETDVSGAEISAFTLAASALSDGQELDFDATGGTITRAVGSWVADGFEVDDEITISGAGSNNGTYTVSGVTATSLSLEESLNDADNVTGAAITATGAALSDGQALDFDDTIVRAVGSWITDGYEADQLIYVSGAGSNSGYYLVESVTATTLILAAETAIATAASGVEGVSIEIASDSAAAEMFTVTFNNNGAGRDTIVLSSDSWADAGVVAGQLLNIKGAGANNGFVTIDEVSGSTLYLSTDDALTDAEISGSIKFTAGVEQTWDASPTLDFTHVDPRDTISRSSGSWLDDGFAVGMAVDVDGTSDNNGSYLINGISGDGLTLYFDALSTLENETVVSGATVTNYQPRFINIHETLMDGTPSLDFTSVSGSYDTINRFSGSWVDDGFRDGQTITVSDSGSNDGEYRVASVTDDTLYLYVLDTVVDESAATGVSIVGAGITDGIDMPTLVTEDLAVSIANQITELQQAMVDHAGDTDAIAAYEVQLEQLTQQGLDLGVLSEDDPGLTNSNYSVSPITEYMVTYIALPDIEAGSGDINVYSSFFSGTGSLIASGDTLIDVVNASPYYLRVNDMAIPSLQGGSITFNVIEVDSNEDINAAYNIYNLGTADIDETAAFTSIITSGSDEVPLISISNTFDPDFAVQAEFEDAAAPDIYVLGSLSNLSGTIRISNDEGSIIVKYDGSSDDGAVISAKTIDIDSGRDFVLSSDSYYHAGGDPSGAQDSVQVAGNNIFISARYLNLNGTLQSGRPELSVTLTSDMDADIAAFSAGWNGSQSTRYLTLVSDEGNNIETRYDAETDQIIIDSVAVEGGYMMLSGHILNTNEDASLKVMDGYGDISIENDTSYDIVLNQIDTGGEGIEGVIKIIDTASDSDEDQMKVTVYTRIGDEIAVEVDGVVANSSTGRVLENGYQPLEDQRYVYLTGYDQSKLIAKEYITESFWGIDWLVADPGQQPDNTWVVAEGAHVGLPNGNYIEWNTDTGDWQDTGAETNDYTRTIEVQSGDETYIYSYSYTTTHGWWIFSTTKYHTVSIWGQIDRVFDEVSVKADYAIDIEFIGNDTGSVSVISDQDVYINGSIINSRGTTSISSEGAIIVSSEAAVLEGTNISMDAATGIGSSDSPLRTDLQDGVLNATTTSGDVYIEEIDGGLVVGTISTSSGDVVLTADGDITAADDTSLITGDSISLTAAHGTLGSASRALRIDSGSANDPDGGQVDRFNAWALDDVYLEEVSGDLHVESITSKRGDVEITLNSGDILDFNDNDTDDERTIAELSTLWDDMMLTGSAAEQAMQANVAAYEGLKIREYKSYWSYRNQQDDPSVYDADFQVTLSDEARDYYSDVLGWDDAAIEALELKRTDEYHSLHTTWGALGDTYDPDYSYTLAVGSDEYNELTEGYAWTESELSNTISASTFRTKTDTETKIEAANITAENIRLYVTGGVGAITGSVDIDLTNGISDLTDEEKVMMAAAESDDMIFLNADGEEIDPLDTEATAVTLRIILHGDVDVEASGGVSITATDHIYLGSEHDIQAESIVAGGEARIKVGGSIVNYTNDGSTNIFGAGLILEAGDGHIGTADALFQVEMPEGTTLSARAMGDILLSATLGDLAIDTIYSEQGSASLEAEAGSILDGVDNGLWNIQVAGELNLAAFADIGSAGNALDADLYETGVYNATAGGEIFLAETAGDMLVGQIVAGGDADLTAAVSILDAGGEANGLAGNPDADVIANSITLSALLGSLGASGDDLDINSSVTSLGMLTASSRRNAYLIETAGDLILNQVGTGEDSTAFIVSPNRILNGGSGLANVISGATRLYAGDDIGTEDNPLYTEVAGLEGRSTSGTVWIGNTGYLTVGGVSEADGVQADGGVNITNSSPVTVVETIQAADIVITAGDDAADGTVETNDDLIVRSGVTVFSTGGDVILRAGDNLIIETGATVMAAGIIELYGDYNEVGNADAAGGIVDLQGSVIANALEIYGNSDDDTIVLPGLPSGVPATVWMGDGNDLLYVGSEAIPSANTGGVADSLADLLTVYGEGGTDTLNVDDSGDEDGNIGTLTDSRITGLGMAEGIVYDTVEEIEINLGSGDDTFNVRSTSVGTRAQINANGGDDSLFVSSDPENGNLDGIRGDVHFDGGDGRNNMILSDRGNTGGRSDVVLSENSISGFGDGVGSGTITHENINDLELLMGSGDDSLTVTGTLSDGITRLRLGAGDDRVEMRDESVISDGLAVLFGEAGADNIDASAWNSDLVLVGDDGSTISANNMATLRSVETENASGDGDDTLIGGSGDDIILGGMGTDTLSGNDGNDILLGDGGKVSMTGNVSKRVETIDHFIGGNDTLEGGKGFDIMFGGAGNDFFKGNMSEDIIIGDYARVTLQAGKVEYLVRLGQGNLDLIAKTQFGLYSADFRGASLPDLGSVKRFEFETDSGETSGEQIRWPRIQERLSHAGDMLRGFSQQGILEFIERENDLPEQQESLPAEERKDDLPVPSDGGQQPLEQQVEPIKGSSVAGELPPALADGVAAVDGRDESQSGTVQGIEAMVAGLAFWRVDSSRKKKKSLVDRDALSQLVAKAGERKYMKWTGSTFRR